MSPLSASLFGDKIHVVLPGESTQILQIVKQLLTDMGVNAETEIINPSLEDIFISMIASDTGGVSNVS